MIRVAYRSYLLCSLTILNNFISNALVLNRTELHSMTLQNITTSNLALGDDPLQDGNNSSQQNFNVSDDVFVYIFNKTQDVFKADGTNEEDSNNFANDSIGYLEKLDTPANKNKSFNDLRITSEIIQSDITSSPAYSESDIAIVARPTRLHEKHYTILEGILIRNISHQNKSDINLYEVDSQRKEINIIRTTIDIPEEETSTTKMTENSSGSPILSEFSNDKRQNTDFEIKTNLDLTTSGNQLYSPKMTVKTSSVHMKHAIHKHIHHHKAMHHLSLVPIEDGPFGSLIWKDKKYLISVLIPIVIGIVGAACIIGMTYTARYCQKYEVKIREIRATMTHQTSSINDQITLLTDSSDEL